MPSPVHPYSEYGVALRTLRAARGWLGILLFLCAVAQVMGFAVMWFSQQPYAGMRPAYEPTKQFDNLVEAVRRIMGTTQPHGVTTAPAEPFYPGSVEGRKLNVRRQWDTCYTMSVPLTQMMGLMAVCSQVIVIFLTLLVILVAQAPGVAQVTRSLIWSILLLFMVMPWQYFAKDFPFPGVLYGYQEMLRLIGPHVASNTDHRVFGLERMLVYARFIFWPAFAMFVLLIISERFRAGIVLAIGHPLQSMMQPRPQAPAKPTPLTPMSR